MRRHHRPPDAMRSYSFLRSNSTMEFRERLRPTSLKILKSTIFMKARFRSNCCVTAELTDPWVGPFGPTQHYILRADSLKHGQGYAPSNYFIICMLRSCLDAIHPSLGSQQFTLVLSAGHSQPSSYRDFLGRAL